MGKPSQKKSRPARVDHKRRADNLASQLDALAEISREQVREIAQLKAQIEHMNRIDLFHDRFVVVTAQDTPNLLESRGPIAHETMIGQSDAAHVIERAQMLSRYGDTYIAKLSLLGTLSEAREIFAEAEASEDEDFTL